MWSRLILTARRFSWDEIKIACEQASQTVLVRREKWLGACKVVSESRMSGSRGFLALILSKEIRFEAAVSCFPFATPAWQLPFAENKEAKKLRKPLEPGYRRIGRRVDFSEMPAVLLSQRGNWSRIETLYSVLFGVYWFCNCKVLFFMFLL